MRDYAVLCYGQETGIILEAETIDEAKQQITLIGLKNRGYNFNLVAI